MSRPRKYDDELRERAARLEFESGRPIAHLARDLGIHRESLRGWVREGEADAGSRHDRLTTAEPDRLKQLERENRELQKANEIFKSASVFFFGEDPVLAPQPLELVTLVRRQPVTAAALVEIKLL